MKEINLKVEGMMCTGCENRIQNAVKNMNTRHLSKPSFKSPDLI